jgi:hypothetical protein
VAWTGAEPAPVENGSSKLADGTAGVVPEADAGRDHPRRDVRRRATARRRPEEPEHMQAAAKFGVTPPLPRGRLG